MWNGVHFVSTVVSRIHKIGKPLIQFIQSIHSVKSKAAMIIQVNVEKSPISSSSSTEQVMDESLGSGHRARASPDFPAYVSIKL